MVSIIGLLENHDYMSSVDPKNRNCLLKLQRSMMKYYNDLRYHEEWVKENNFNWQSIQHPSQLRMCKLIPPGARLLEVGCGDGDSGKEIKSRICDIKYIGIDLNPKLWRGKQGFVAAKADELPFHSGCIDVVISMFTIEHLVFPASFLDEAWRVLTPSGRLIIISPDFIVHAMPSDSIGFTYGSGREKLKRGRILDAIKTAYDVRIRLYLMRRYRRKKIRQSLYYFPILKRPRNLRLGGFTPDCDAVYPVCPEEIVNYFSVKKDYLRSEIFYRDKYLLGLLLVKR